MLSILFVLIRRTSRMIPHRPPYVLRQKVKRDLNMGVLIACCYRLIWRYMSAILSTNPCNSAYVHRDGAFFQIMYICFYVCKKGFKYDCRPIICLDTCHLKGKCKGQLLCVIGQDGNDDMFPITFAIVEAEIRKSWLWFIQILVEDLCKAED
jgi:hypothetical protein